ncbi:coiled-coil domain-containing protein 42-like [Pelobates fuscus]|uniref:coiled-coil domain-containing protein 42-like n=1 Tax=Pelobates fuscus TaxID=191477 RepID=UPI002FE4F24C
MKDLARRREKLRVKEDELRKYRLRFQDFILDKEEKCVKSARKAEKERNVLNQKEKELIVLREEHGKMKQKRAQIQAQMQKYSKFYQFLQKVVDMSAEEVGDIFYRFRTLDDTLSYQSKGVQEAQDTLQKVKEHLNQYLECSKNESLQLRRHLDNLQTRLKQSLKECLEWESRSTHIHSTAAKNNILQETIRIAILNLFHRICRHIGGVQDIAASDTMEQLQMIQRHIQDLADISQMVVENGTGSTQKQPQPAL